jgi:hypothetical protein
LLRVAEAMLRDPALKARTAIKDCGVTDEVTVRRLQRRWRADREVLMAEARGRIELKQSESEKSESKPRKNKGKSEPKHAALGANPAEDKVSLVRPQAVQGIAPAPAGRLRASQDNVIARVVAAATGVRAEHAEPKNEKSARVIAAEDSVIAPVVAAGGTAALTPQTKLKTEEPASAVATHDSVTARVATTAVAVRREPMDRKTDKANCAARPEPKAEEAVPAARKPVPLPLELFAAFGPLHAFRRALADWQMFADAAYRITSWNIEQAVLHQRLLNSWIGRR